MQAAEMLTDGMIVAGSVLMVYNIVRYWLFMRYVRQMGNREEKQPVLLVPFVLLVFFLMGYLTVWIFGKPDFVMASILFGGSFFVFLILRMMWKIIRQIRDHEELQIALEAAEQASVAKTIFLSNMSHDIRTPLNAILGYAQLALREGTEPEQMRYYLARISGSGQHLLSLINDVLEMSRIESGRMELVDAPVNLTEVMEEVRELFALQMKDKKLSFSVSCRDVDDPVVLCDRGRLDRILLNLLSNAMKFTPEGGEVRAELVQLGRTGEDRGCYEFHVKDTGIGMSPEFAAHVFEAFERERTATVSGIQGTGLGMSITKRIVDRMGGDIVVETEQGKGTEFIVKVAFPVVAGQPAARSLPGEEEDAARPGGRYEGRRALLAEDMEVNREIAHFLLNEIGFTVDCAANGKEAFEMIAAAEPNYYDVVLMDIQMPVMDGFEATRRIRALPDPGRAAVPIIALTANAFSEDVRKTREAGMSGHVAKPIDVKRLEHTLQELL